MFLSQFVLLATASLAAATPAMIMANARVSNTTAIAAPRVALAAGAAVSVPGADIVTNDVVPTTATPAAPSTTSPLGYYKPLLDQAVNDIASAPGFVPNGTMYDLLSAGGPQDPRMCHIRPAVDLRPYSFNWLLDESINDTNPYLRQNQASLVQDVPWYLFSPCCKTVEVRSGGWVQCWLGGEDVCDQGHKCFTENMEIEVPLLDWECGGSEEEREDKCARAKMNMSRKLEAEQRVSGANPMLARLGGTLSCYHFFVVGFVILKEIILLFF